LLAADVDSTKPAAPPDFPTIFVATRYRPPMPVAAVVMTAAVDPSDPRQFIAENAWQASYWADLAREAATIGDDSLLAYPTRKAAAYARAFAGAAKDMLLANDGEAR
jgi:hypothetical protein